eukprot:COSAG01_NODE_417_length_17291_cov_610.598825_6_plen_40_part_00
MNACVFARADRREVRRTNKSEGGRKSEKDMWQSLIPNLR